MEDEICTYQEWVGLTCNVDKTKISDANLDINFLDFDIIKEKFYGCSDDDFVALMNTV